MTKLKELERKLERYQRRYQRLLKKGEMVPGRYGDEFRDVQLRVLETAITEIKKEIIQVKRRRKKRI